MAEIYRLFADASLDFSAVAASIAYEFESTGKGLLDENTNGFYQGKRCMDITVKMWREDIAVGMLLCGELEAEFPKWFLDLVLE